MCHKFVSVAFSLGSNLGIRKRNLKEAINYLSQGLLNDVRVSSFYNFKPVECPLNTPTYLNAAIIGITRYDPPSLLAECQDIEVRMGRPHNHGYHENRVIDIDILLFGELQLKTKNLTIPHPQMTQREFVLKPLSEIAPDWIIAPENKTVAAYLHQVTS